MVADVDWDNRTNSEKVFMILNKISTMDNFVQYSHMVIANFYNSGMVDDASKQKLADLLDKLQRGEPVEDLIQSSLEPVSR